jgi:hypothetical protein
MSKVNDGGPAFPCLEDGEGFAKGWYGMTLRDYFAAKAMTGIIANRNVDHTITFEEISGRAYKQADAMLKAREE